MIQLNEIIKSRLTEHTYTEHDIGEERARGGGAVLVEIVEEEKLYALI